MPVTLILAYWKRVVCVIKFSLFLLCTLTSCDTHQLALVAGGTDSGSMGYVLAARETAAMAMTARDLMKYMVKEV